MRLALGLFVLGAALRFSFAAFAAADGELKPDERDRYLEIARNLRAGEGFAIRGHETAQVMPLWPLALAALPPAIPPFFLSATLSSLAIVLAFLLARGLGGPRLALFVAAFMALDLDQAVLGGRALTEPLFTVLLLGFSLFWVRARPAPAALLLGLATLTRPEAFLVPLALAPFARERKSIAVLGLGVVLAVAPWAVRNHAAFDAFVPFTTTGGITLHAGLNEQEARLPFRKKGDGQAARYPPATRMAERGTELFWDREYRARAVEFARAQPGEAAQLAAAKLVRLWTPLQRKGRSAVYAVATLLALWALVRRVRFAVALVAPMLLVLTFVGVAFLAIARYRAPYHPYVFLLAAAAVVRPVAQES